MLGSSNKRTQSEAADDGNKRKKKQTTTPSSSKQLSISSFFAKPPSSTPTEQKVTDSADSTIDLTSSSPSPVKPLAKPIKSSKANKFKFNPSNGLQDRVAEEDDDRREIRMAFLSKFAESSSKTLGKRKADYSEPEDDDVDEHCSSDVEEAPKPTSKKQNTTSQNVTLTPLEKQVVELKAKFSDCLLMVEVGYKYRFFGEDATIAAKELNIVAFMNHSFLSASIPTHRLQVHVKRLVQQGYKVGIVKQVETAALKAVGNNKYAPFTREVTGIFTKGTFIDDIGGGDEDEAFGTAGRDNYLMALSEETVGAEGRTLIGVMAVQVSTGDIVYDQFEDCFLRTELETLLSHIQPVEIIIPELLSQPTEKVIRRFGLRSGQTDKVRIESPKDAFFSAIVASRMVADGFPDAQDSISDLPSMVTVCLSALKSYLKTFNLDSVLHLKTFTKFSSHAFMNLNANALACLEIYQNATDYSEKGSLLSVLDYTKSKAGRRLLNKWVGKPLTRIDDLNQRTQSVEECLDLARKSDPTMKKLMGLLSQVPDLEKALMRVYYGRSTPSDLNSLLIALEKISNIGMTATSLLLKDIFASFSSIQQDISYFRQLINEKAASENNRIDLFGDEDKYEDITRLKKEIQQIHTDMRLHLKEARKTLSSPSLEFVSVAGVDYLLEVKNIIANKAPASWIKVNGTKAVSRFHTPEALSGMAKLARGQERLDLACAAAFKELLKEVSEKYDAFRQVIHSLAVLDCLVSLGTLAMQPGYTKPQFSDEAGFLDIQNGRHPIVEKFVTNFVPNDISLRQEGPKCLLITGPNMNGKSTFIRQVALIVVMAQIGSHVPADFAKLGLFDAVHTRMGASDDIARGQSTFMKELSETSDILHSATPRSFVLLDELGRGTSTMDGTAIAWAVLKHMIENVKCAILFVTHYPILGKLQDELNGAVLNYHMGFLEQEENGEKVFLYKLTAGLSHRSFGLNVAKLANLPPDVIQTAQAKSIELEVLFDNRRMAARQSKAASFFQNLWKGYEASGNTSQTIQELWQ
ncbi:hypothetical protein SmJEL517_g04677 [Synchytrium microbalum]|uniref:DNA mismatch repair protein MSH3 n=1 Tax=Synchytrium microbalum TaxID=1806994 RepID=A0A507BXK1_9FUNG|nr:uncharacterized protein SmJEL517_g04677 [Synchytrium microbalum]TPX32162.1 hypothetical protein SmJEL517_g04677 [Synchytrium microbalum]